MESKHTAGEWTIENGIQLNITQGKRGFVIANITKQATQFIGNREEAEANAKLIASAPELLAALIPLYTFCDCTPEGIFDDAIYKDLQHLVKAAKEAIDKATL